MPVATDEGGCTDKTDSFTSSSVRILFICGNILGPLSGLNTFYCPRLGSDGNENVSERGTFDDARPVPMFLFHFSPFSEVLVKHHRFLSTRILSAVLVFGGILTAPIIHPADKAREARLANTSAALRPFSRPGVPPAPRPPSPRRGAAAPRHRGRPRPRRQAEPPDPQVAVRRGPRRSFSSPRFVGLAAPLADAPAARRPRARPSCSIPRVLEVLAGLIGVFVLRPHLLRWGCAASRIPTPTWRRPSSSSSSGSGSRSPCVVFSTSSPRSQPAVARSVGRSIGWIAARVGAPAEPLAYPAWLGRWPAAAGILAFAWVELVYTSRVRSEATSP